VNSAAQAAVEQHAPIERPLFAVADLSKQYSLRVGAFRHAVLRAVDGVSLSVARGDTLGLVGESGCGKSTLGRVALRLEEPTAGEIWYGDVELSALQQGEVRRYRADLQMVFQDPLGSLNPRMTVFQAIAEPLRLHGIAPRADVPARVNELLERVGLSRDHLGRYPHQLSGGQQQRVAIARALAPEPKVVILDEPTSALDVSVQAKLVNLLRKLQADFALTQIFISHDLSVVGYLANRVAVMYLGRIVESGPTAAIYDQPRHPYTAALMAAVPDDDLMRRRARGNLSGEVPSALNPPLGCHLAPRCPFAVDRCREEDQTLRDVGPDHSVACWRSAAGEIEFDRLRSANRSAK
jgi:oligopeptide/dipeptide ABC transporter ATP-binding protein